MDHRAKHAVVLVLGDVGRSPRMQYHALSLLEHGHYVSLVGYAGEGLIPPLQDALISSSDDDAPASPYRGKLHVLRMKPYQPSQANILCRLLYYPIRLTSLLYCVMYTLWVQLSHAPHTNLPVDVVLVQNPPSVPTLILAYMYCVWNSLRRRHRPRFVIDWHNLGYTMFDEPASDTPFPRTVMQNSLRRAVKIYERTMSSLADAHLCVTQAMEGWLRENFGVHKHVRVLYDKPPLLFRPILVEEQHNLFLTLKLEEKKGISQWIDPVNSGKTQNESIEQTLFTTVSFLNCKPTTIELRNDRPALLISSTSWTPDEDFSILLDALDCLQASIDERTEGKSFPNVLVIVTGKGPQREKYLPLLEEFNNIHSSIKIYTLWLEAADYPKLLGCATLGISLHTSTSGLDLPMKVLDMFGCQVPVCAIGFNCLNELVKDGVNGRVFKDGYELSDQLYELLDGYPNNTDGQLEKFKTNIGEMTRWKENWQDCAHHLIVGEWENS